MKMKISIWIIFIILLSCFSYSLPDYFDWRIKDGQNWMSPVRDQGNCGSCWAHSVLGTFEAQYNIDKNNPYYDENLSEEYLVSDCYGSGSCCGISGTNLGSVLLYIKDYGVPDEECMPYTDTYSCSCSEGTCDGNCNYATASNCSDHICSDRCGDWQNRLWLIDNYEAISSSIEAVKTYLYETGPISAVMYWDAVVNESARTFTCSPDSGVGSFHAVVITGYNEKDVIGYYEYHASDYFR